MSTAFILQTGCIKNCVVFCVLRTYIRVLRIFSTGSNVALNFVDFPPKKRQNVYVFHGLTVQHRLYAWLQGS